MAITWGTEIKSGSGNGLKLGYEFTQSPATVGTSTSSVVVTLKVYVWTRYSVSDSTNTVAISGDFSWSGGANISHGGSGGTTLVRTLTRTVATSFAAAVKSAFSGSITGVNAVPGTARVSGSTTTAKRPASEPAPVINATAVRVSDTRQVVSWTNQATTAAPYEQIVIERWDNVRALYLAIATVGGTSTSYTDSTTSANARYRYRVRPRTGGVDALSYTYTNYLTTMQTPPSGVKATRSGGGILVEWTGNAAAPATVEVWHAADGVWDVSRLASLPGGTTSWTHVSPDPAVGHAYRLRVTSAEPALTSGFGATSNAVLPLAPPDAPSGLVPAAGAFDATGAEVFRWKHNPADTTAQSAYELRYRIGAGEWVTTGKVASAVSSRAIAAGTLTNGTVVEWQVRTWGEFPTESPWSQSAVVQLSARPVVTITEPGAVGLSSRITLRWLYFDGEGEAQTSYRIRLEDEGGSPVWAATGSGDATQYLIPHPVAEGEAYTVFLAARDGAGVWSDEASQAFTVDYADPVAPIITATWHLDLGAVTVQIEHPAPGPGEVPAVAAEIWRSTGGDEWKLLADGLGPDTVVTDFIPALDTVNYYRVVSVSATPSYRESPPAEVLTPSQGWIFVNGGPGFGRVVKIRDNAKTSYSPKRAKVLNHFAGREHMIETIGELRSLGISLSARIGGGSSSLQEWEAVALLPAPLCYRDGTRRTFVSVDSTGSSYERVFQDVDLSFEKVDFRE